MSVISKLKKAFKGNGLGIQALSKSGLPFHSCLIECESNLLFFKFQIEMKNKKEKQELNGVLLGVQHKTAAISNAAVLCCR